MPGILGQDVIATTAKDGKVPFIAADDIAETAFKALVDEPSHNTDHLIMGPELLTYDEVSLTALPHHLRLFDTPPSHL